MKILPFVIGGGILAAGAYWWFSRKPAATPAVASQPQLSTSQAVLSAAISEAQKLLLSGKTPAEAAQTAADDIANAIKINL